MATRALRKRESVGEREWVRVCCWERVRKREYGRKRVGEKVSERERERPQASDYKLIFIKGSIMENSETGSIQLSSFLVSATPQNRRQPFQKKTFNILFHLFEFFLTFLSRWKLKKSVKKDWKKTFLVSSFNRSYLEKRPSKVLLPFNYCWPLFLALNWGPWKW